MFFKRIHIICLLVIFSSFMLFGIISINNGKIAKAGVSRIIVASDESFREEISVQKWYIKGTVKHEHDKEKNKGTIIFEEESGSSTRIISTAFAADLREKGLEDCLNGSVTLNISKLKGNFYMVFGLDEAFYGVDQGECSAISFSDNSGNIKVSVVNIAGNNIKTVKNITDTITYRSDITLDFIVKGSGKIYLSINGINYINYDNNTICDSEGYFGFAQSKGSGVRITSANVYSQVYDNPENANVNETFDDDSFDASRLYVSNNEIANGYYTPEGMICEDGVLKFSNITSYGFVSTNYEFSNFEMNFDITHLEREFKYDEEGNVLVPGSNFIGISVGSPTRDIFQYGITQAVFFYFAPIYQNGKLSSLYVVGLDNYKIIYEKKISNDDDNFWNVKNAYDYYGREKIINMKVDMIDGILSCSFKWEGESQSRYRTLYTYDLGYTPLGYIQIHGQGFSGGEIVENSNLPCTNVWIDNIRIVNRDEGGRSIEPSYISSKIDFDEDFDYLDTWNYRRNTIEGVDEGCESSIRKELLFAIFIPILVGVLVNKRRRSYEKYDK